MPYCPKCDMEFVDGITACTDCGGPLMESEEAAKAAKKQEEAEFAQQMEQYYADMAAQELADTDVPAVPYQQVQKMAEHHAQSRVYVKKEQKYEDLKSSASAFIIVGVALLVISVLCWTGILKIPMVTITRLIFQSALTIMGILSVFVSLHSSSAAKKLAPQIDEENKATRELIRWFMDSYDAEDIDREIDGVEELSPEELSLKRFQIIQDYLVTHHDLPEPAYVDALGEEIYGKLFD